MAVGSTILVIDDSPTILKVVQLVLAKAGFRIVTASDGEQGVATARADRPDLILLDFVMPKMNGYQVCRALAGDAELRDVPVVLMSAKGDQVGERFVKVMGIVDYITKPFSPEAITAVVQHTIAKYGQDARAQRLADGSVPDPLDVTGEDLAARGVHESRAAALDEARAAIADAVAPKIAELVQLAVAVTGEGDGPAGADTRVLTDADAIADCARGALDDATLARLLGALRPGLFAPAEASYSDDEQPLAVLSGDLRLVPIAEVLQLLQNQAHSGILTATRARGKVEVYFRQGRVDFAVAQAIGEEFLLGRFIVALDLVGRADVEAVVEAGRGGHKVALGQQLVKLGYLTEDEVRQAVARQTCELVYEILRWNFGRFDFRATRELPPLAVEASLALEVDGILMEGFRRVDEWHLIEREIESFDLVFLRNEDAVAHMGRGRLTREELTILELVNGKHAVKDIVRQARMGSFEVSKMLYRLLSVKLIRRRVMPVAV